MSESNAVKRARKVRLVCADFDGTFTDGMVYTDQHGTETVRCSRRDVLGIEMLQRIGIEVHVISKETNPVVAVRCRKMSVFCDQAVESGEGKAEIMARLAKRLELRMDQVAYIGDDVNDLSAMDLAGFAATVADGHPLVKAVAHWEAKARGGEHAVREFCEYILRAQGHSVEY